MLTGNHKLERIIEKAFLQKIKIVFRNDVSSRSSPIEAASRYLGGVLARYVDQH